MALGMASTPNDDHECPDPPDVVLEEPLFEELLFEELLFDEELSELEELWELA